MSDYENDSWPKIYDIMYSVSPWFLSQRDFYLDEDDGSGTILEIACGTGLITFELLKKNRDIYGFDLSPCMLAVFSNKAAAAGISVAGRISQQNMINFSYDILFDCIILPSRSFLHLTEQDDQINCLKNIYRHLKPGGKLIINFFNPSLVFILKYADENVFFEPRGVYPGTDGKKYRLESAQKNNIAEQLQSITWRFTCIEDNTVSEEHMKIRWIYKNECELLLKTAGFRTWQLYGDFKKSPFTSGSPEQVWIVRK